MSVRVGAAFDYTTDLVPEAPDGLPGSLSRLAILDGVVEECGDGFILVRAVVVRDRAGAEEVAQVRDRRALACLVVAEMPMSDDPDARLDALLDATEPDMTQWLP